MLTADNEAQPGSVAKGADKISPTDPEQQLASLRQSAAAKYRTLLATIPSPIRVMARMVNEVQQQAADLNIPPAIVARGLVNRTIGDVNVRTITEVVDGVDYSTIGEELGLIMPGESIGGRVSTGETFLRVRERMVELERELLYKHGFDLRIYDVYGIGNPVLREQLAARFRDHYGIPARMEQTFASIGALDSLDRATRALNYHFQQKYGVQVGYAFPAPGFAVTAWQVRSLGMELITYQTEEADRFKLTGAALAQLLEEHPNLRILYLTVSNNPTAFSYSPDEIRALLEAVEQDGRELAIMADLAYIGTGDEAEDRDRMAAFLDPRMLQRTIFIHSLSKTFTLTGDRMGFSTLFNEEWAQLLMTAWNNTTAGLPAEWQLRYMANLELFEQNRGLQAKIRALYGLRREDLRRQLRELDSRYGLFEVIGLDDNTTVYNWSKFRDGEDMFSLFEKTGVAGVDGRGFGYSSCYVRFSVGFTTADVMRETRVLD